MMAALFDSMPAPAAELAADIRIPNLSQILAMIAAAFGLDCDLRFAAVDNIAAVVGIAVHIQIRLQLQRQDLLDTT